MLRHAILVMLAVIVVALLVMRNSDHDTGGQSSAIGKFSDLQSDVNAMAARPRPAVDSRLLKDVALDRGFELYRDRGTLNMRRGLGITLIGFSSDYSHTDVATAEECKLMLATFALKCVALQAKAASRPSTNSGKRKMEMSLAFQERGQSLSFQVSARERFRMVTKKILTLDNGEDPLAARKMLYHDIGRLCTALTSSRDCSLLAGKIEFKYVQGRVNGNGEIIVGYLDPLR